MAGNAVRPPSFLRAENIALLELLHNVPDLPSSNPKDRPSFSQKEYALPFERERSLTSRLAFLSNIKEDPSHIPAVAVQQDTGRQSLNVLLSVNKAYPEDGNALLNTVKGGFEAIFSILSGVSESKFLVPYGFRY